MENFSLRAPGAGHDESGRRLRVLVAEDDTLSQALIRTLLQTAGHEATVVSGGAEAVARVTTEPFDLVLMDLQMPGMDGFAATAAIREQERASGMHIPIIALTAHALAGYREQCLAAGMDDYFSKPITFPELCRVLQTYGGSARPADEPAPTLWDRDQARANSGDDPALLAELVSIFVKESPLLMQRIRDAAQRGDAAGLARAAHTLKGEVGCIGAVVVAERAGKLEELGRGGNLREASATVEQLGREIELLRQTVRDGVEAQPAGVG